MEQGLRQSGQKQADLCNDMIYWRHAAHNKRTMQINTTIKFGLAALAVGAFSILPGLKA
jgi:hypothetical protein